MTLPKYGEIASAWADRTVPMQLTFPKAGVPRDVMHGMKVIPDGFLVVWADATIKAVPGLAWTRDLAYLRAGTNNAHATVIFYTLMERPFADGRSDSVTSGGGATGPDVEAHAPTHQPGGSDPVLSLALTGPFSTAQDIVGTGLNVTLRRDVTSGSVGMCGGSVNFDTNYGAYIRVLGNTSGAPGVAQVVAGNVAGSAITLLRGDYNPALTVDGATGLVSVPYGQVKFPATQNPSTDANTVDDYKEGNWTVTDVSGQGLTITTVVAGNYVKFGQAFIAFFYIALPVTANGALVTLGGFTPVPYGATGSGVINQCTKGQPLTMSVINNAFYVRDVSGNPMTYAGMSGHTLSGTLIFRAST